jgi:hypothetical protein
LRAADALALARDELEACGRHVKLNINGNLFSLTTISESGYIVEAFTSGGVSITLQIKSMDLMFWVNSAVMETGRDLLDMIDSFIETSEILIDTFKLAAVRLEKYQFKPDLYSALSVSRGSTRATARYTDRFVPELIVHSFYGTKTFPPDEVNEFVAYAIEAASGGL